MPTSPNDGNAPRSTDNLAFNFISILDMACFKYVRVFTRRHILSEAPGGAVKRMDFTAPPLAFYFASMVTLSEPSPSASACSVISPGEPVGRRMTKQRP